MIAQPSADPVIADPPPDSDAVRPVTVLTCVWALALVVLLVGSDALDVANPGEWRAVAATGVAFGMFGILVTRRRRAGLRGREARGKGQE